MNVRLKSNLGFGLIEVLVAVAIMGIIAVGMMQLMEGMTKSSRANRISTENSMLGARIAKYAGLGILIARSAGNPGPLPGGNDNLQMCVYGTGTGICNEATPIGFTLVDQANTAVAGPTGFPIRYGVNGTTCPGPASADCPFEAFVSFVAVCPASDPTPCAGAQSIQVTYTVRQAAGIFINNAAVMKGTTGSVVFPLPLPGLLNGVAGRLALWSSTTDLVGGNIGQGTGAESLQIQVNPAGDYAGPTEVFVVNNGNIRIGGNILSNTGQLRAATIAMGNWLGGIGPTCLGSEEGVLRHVNGALQVCDDGFWRWAAGDINSGTFGGYGNLPAYGAQPAYINNGRVPRLPFLYACPQGGSVGAAESAGRGPVCAGQVSIYRECWMDGATMVPCSPLF